MRVVIKRENITGVINVKGENDWAGEHKMKLSMLIAEHSRHEDIVGDATI